ncbi:DUF5719 family protein [Isoptericola sp. b441]|uniref:DUF5719 family protein n=1 Tax=Actinotalea lenta TaxID=3064654 RepID=A0ABT9DCH6_9CELL|nr:MULTISPECIES: DUF5719 family protein [unclassified Isoptericola]MDO8108572.1 DUF5719 family protein [Isoptericola sp. b441]MDO8119982.1 DUF5719 family protein [Isoptericola sp. b490]
MRRAVAIVVAVLGALVSLALVAGVVVLPGWEPVAPVPAAPMAMTVPAAPTDLVCPGPARLATEAEQGGDAAYDPQFDPSPSASTTRVGAISVDRPDGVAVPALVEPLGSTSQLADLTPAAGGGAVSLTNPEAGVVVHAQPDAGGPAWVAGSVGVSTEAGDLRGLAGATCRPAANEAWLVGGATTVGSSARLVLQNPGSTPAQVSLELWGSTGPVEPVGSGQYLVPAGAERVVLLEGVAAEQPRLVVHVQAAGGLVAAYLQDSELRGLTSAGLDDVVPGAAPATRQVVPGVALAGSPADGADPGVLRLLAPDEAGTADVHVLGPDGEVPLPGGHVSLDAGSVLDLPLGGLPAGDYTLVVDADVPVVAAAMITRGQGVGAAQASEETPLDRAWAASVEPGTVGPVALPGLGTWHLVVAVPPGDSGPADVTVDAVSSAGVTTTSTPVVPGTSVTLQQSDLGTASVDGLVVRSDDPRVAWAVVLDVRASDGDLITVLSPLAPPAPQPEVAVRLG